MVTAMVNFLLAWTMVGVAGLAFAGFLFGISAALACLARPYRSARARVSVNEWRLIPGFGLKAKSATAAAQILAKDFRP
jgi:hypothetical protein